MKKIDGNSLREMTYASPAEVEIGSRVLINLKEGKTIQGILSKYEYAANDPHLLVDVVLNEVKVNVMDIDELKSLVDIEK